MSDWLPRAQNKLASLNYDGLNQASYEGAGDLVLELARIKMKPVRIVRTAENLIAFWLFNGGKTRIEACEDGEFVLSILYPDRPATHLEFKTASAVGDELTREVMGDSRW